MLVADNPNAQQRYLQKRMQTQKSHHACHSVPRYIRNQEYQNVLITAKRKNQHISATGLQDCVTFSQIGIEMLGKHILDFSQSQQAKWNLVRITRYNYQDNLKQCQKLKMISSYTFQEQKQTKEYSKNCKLQGGVRRFTGQEH